MSRIGNGILVVDKPKGETSARVLGHIKRITGVRKAGHTGTLDPMATGVLVCCLNRATKLARFFLHSDKAYRAVLALGAETDTQDATGRVIAQKAVPKLAEDMLRSVFDRFTGQIEQIPPVYSALKHKGQPLYKLARNGRPVQKAARKIVIKRLGLLQIGDNEIIFQVTCSSGTYIRTLCADLGTALGCGGYLKDLRRIESGGFSITEALSIEEIARLAQEGRLQQKIVPMAESMPFMPTVRADKVLTEKINYGRIVKKADLKDRILGDYNGFIKVTDRHNRLLAIIHPKERGDSYDYDCTFPH